MMQKEGKVSKKISDIAAIFGGVKSKHNKKKKKSTKKKKKTNSNKAETNDELLSLKNNISNSSSTNTRNRWITSPIKENKMVIESKSKSMSYTYTATNDDDDDDDELSDIWLPAPSPQQINIDDDNRFFDDGNETKPKQIDSYNEYKEYKEYKEYYQMSPIATPPQPKDVSPPHSFNYFSVINENEMEYEESLSLNNTISIEQLLRDYNIYRNNNNGILIYNYFINILNIKYANQLSQYAPNEILTEEILNKIDYETQITMNKLLSFISYQIVTKYWFSNKLKEWLKFEHDNKQNMEIMAPSINNKQYMLFDGDNIDIHSNKIKMIGNGIKFLNKNIEIDEIWSVTIKIELYTKKQPINFDENQNENENENVFTICIQFIDNDEIFYINDKFEVFFRNKSNNNYLKTICQHRLTSDSEIYLTVNNKKNAPNVILQSDDIHDIKHHFDVKQCMKGSKVKIYIKQFYGECIYGLYPISN